MCDFATGTDTMFEKVLNTNSPGASGSARVSEEEREELRSDSVGRCMM